MKLEELSADIQARLILNGIYVTDVDIYNEDGSIQISKEIKDRAELIKQLEQNASPGFKEALKCRRSSE